MAFPPTVSPADQDQLPVSPSLVPPTSLHLRLAPVTGPAGRPPPSPLAASSDLLNRVADTHRRLSMWRADKPPCQCPAPEQSQPGFPSQPPGLADNAPAGSLPPPACGNLPSPHRAGLLSRPRSAPPAAQTAPPRFPSLLPGLCRSTPPAPAASLVLLASQSNQSPALRPPPSLPASSANTRLSVAPSPR